MVIKKKKKILHRSKSRRSPLSKTRKTVLMGTGPSWTATVTYSLTVFIRSSLTLGIRPTKCPALGRPSQEVTPTYLPPSWICHFSQGGLSRPVTGLWKAHSIARGLANPSELVHLQPVCHRIKALGYSGSLFFFSLNKKNKNAFKKCTCILFHVGKIEGNLTETENLANVSSSPS